MLNITNFSELLTLYLAVLVICLLVLFFSQIKKRWAQVIAIILTISIIGAPGLLLAASESYKENTSPRCATCDEYYPFDRDYTYCPECGEPLVVPTNEG